MARLTVEDCLKKEPNRFKLILKASKRARDLERGAEAAVPWDNDKPTVTALREIAEGVFENPAVEQAEAEAEVEVAIETAPAEETTEQVIEETTETTEATTKTEEE